MGLNRRGFFKLLGITGMTLAIGKETIASSGSKRGVEFYGVLYDAARCKGCRGCEFDCAEAHGLKEPLPTKNPA